MSFIIIQIENISKTQTTRGLKTFACIWVHNKTLIIKKLFRFNFRTWLGTGR